MVFIHSVLLFHNVLEPKILTFLKQTSQDLSENRKVECKRKKNKYSSLPLTNSKERKKNLHANLSITWSLRWRGVGTNGHAPIASSKHHQKIKE